MERGIIILELLFTDFAPPELLPLIRAILHGRGVALFTVDGVRLGLVLCRHFYHLSNLLSNLSILKLYVLQLPRLFVSQISACPNSHRQLSFLRLLFLSV